VTCAIEFVGRASRKLERDERTENEGIPLLSAGMILLLLLAMATFFGGADDAWDIDDIVLAVSAAIDGDFIGNMLGDVTYCVCIDGDFCSRMGCIGNCTG
jgi:hypothetical protein